MYKFTPFPILHTSRLKLRQLSFKDEQALYDYQSNKTNFEYVEMPVYTSIDQAKNYIIKMKEGVDKGQWIVWAICLEDTIIGTISIWNIKPDQKKAELGYGIFPSYRRKGYMREALEAVMAYGFKDMALEVIEAYTSHYNQPSKDFLSSFGFDFVKTIEDEYSNNALMDIFMRKS